MKYIYYDVEDSKGLRLNAVSFVYKRQAKQFIDKLKTDKWTRLNSPRFIEPLKIVKKETNEPIVTYNRPITYLPMRGEGQWSRYP